MTWTKEISMKFFVALAFTLSLAVPALAKTVIKPIPQTQYIAALGDKMSKSGSGADKWGFWAQDPGPRGVWLKYFPILQKLGVAPAMWKFDPNDWWLDENGLIMEKPQFPVPAGRYVVTGARERIAVLTVESNGNWSLGNNSTIYDVTHLRCRAANFQPVSSSASCSPASVTREKFPISPTDSMPEAHNCTKQDYQVLIVVGRVVEE